MKFTDFIKTAVGAGAFALAATSADALSLKLEDNLNGSATVEITDGVGGDALDNSVNFSVVPGDGSGGFGGFQLTIASGVNANFPPEDNLFANLTASLLSGFSTGDITLTVSNVFDNTALEPGLQPYFLSQDLVTLTDSGTVETYIGVGDAEFELTTLLNDIASNNASESGDLFGVLNIDKYSITHVINLKAGGSSTNVQGGADFIAPAAVPVPAGILLMGTALAGFGVMRRRKQRA